MAAVAIEPITWWTALFRPTNRLRDHIRELTDDDDYELPMDLTEVELIPDLSPGHVLATGITWEDFCRFLDDKLVWMGPGVYVCDAYNRGIGIYENVLELSNHRCPSLCVYAASGPEIAAATTATCDFLVRLLATNNVNEAHICGYYGSSLPMSGPVLSHFCQESQDSLREFTLGEMILNEEQIHALATGSRPDLEVILSECEQLGDPDCHAAFLECDGGPIQLDGC
jgi:hypothetical protein